MTNTKEIKSTFHSYKMYVKNGEVIIEGTNKETKKFVGIFYLSDVKDLIL